jgi:hypothetical protein
LILVFRDVLPKYILLLSSHFHELQLIISLVKFDHSLSETLIKGGGDEPHVDADAVSRKHQIKVSPQKSSKIVY